MCSRPKAAPISAAVSTQTSGNSRASAAACGGRLPPRRAPQAAGPPSRVRAASDTLSKPATARPARRARPTASIQRCARRASTRSAMSADTTTGRRAARANSRLATARSTISRRGVNHKPRPGSRAATSGTSSPLGPTTKRSRREPVADLAGYDAAALGAVATGLRLAPWRRCARSGGSSRLLLLRRTRLRLRTNGRGPRMISALAVVEIESNAALVGGGEQSRSARRRQDRRNRRGS